MVTQRIKDSIKSKLKEQKVKIFTKENITNALKDTVSSNKLTKIALAMLESGEITWGNRI